MTPELQNFIERELQALARSYVDGNASAVVSAVKWCDRYKHPLPSWASNAIVQLLSGGRKTGVGRLANSDEADRQNRIHYSRWDAVKELRERRGELEAFGYRPTWEDAYANASEMLQNSEAAGSAEAIKRSYQIVERLFRSGKGARFYVG
jgi:hypothetical protein